MKITNPEVRIKISVRNSQLNSHSSIAIHRGAVVAVCVFACVFYWSLETPIKASADVVD